MALLFSLPTKWKGKYFTKKILFPSRKNINLISIADDPNMTCSRPFGTITPVLQRPEGFKSLYLEREKELKTAHS